MSEQAENESAIPRRLTGRRAIVTGAGAGIGRAIAARLSAEGARVLVADVDEQAAEAVARELGPGVCADWSRLTRSRRWRRTSPRMRRPRWSVPRWWSTGV